MRNGLNFLEQTERERFIDGQGCSNTQINRGDCSKQEDRHCDRTPERVLKLVKAFNERNKHQAKGHKGL